MLPARVPHYYDLRWLLATADGVADAAAFCKLIIANPALVARFKANAPLNEWDMPTFYSGGAKGYTDYPALPK